MAKERMNSFFEDYLSRKSLFTNKKTLQTEYLPSELCHRDSQSQQLANILAPLLRKERTSNVFIYGKTGTGKTATVLQTTKSLQEVATAQNISLKTTYLNCKLKRAADTEYRVIAELCRELGKQVPPTGLPTDEVYRIFLSALKQNDTQHLFVLDEIDHLIKKTGDAVLYSLTRLHEQLQKVDVTLIGISNSLSFADELDPRVRSSLSEEEVVFPPYNAPQLQDILRQRSDLAFSKETLQSGVIEKCAALAAREHGDARRALTLLRVAAELADRESQTNVTLEHVDKAEEKIDTDRYTQLIDNQPFHHQLVLYSILTLHKNNPGQLFTGEIYTLYKTFCVKCGGRPLTQRRISDIIAEFDMLGLLSAKVISKGRYGRTRELTLTLPSHLFERANTTLQNQLSL